MASAAAEGDRIDFFSLGSVIIDDIVFPDGSTKMGLLGGGGVHATVGMQVWRTESSRVGFAGRVGGDFSLKHLQKLQASGVDLGGLTTVAERKTPRAWTIFEDERLERRRFLFRTSEDEYRRFFRVSEADVPRLDASLKTARGAHIICGPERLEPLCVALRQHLPRLEAIIFEPSPPAFAPEEASRMAAAAPLAEIFSAGLEESRTMLGDAKMSPEDVCRRFREWGARLVVLRMGAAGSLVFTEKGEFIPVPALPLPAVVDVTGAGNAYCGGFLVAWVRTRDALHAALCGAVSASFTVEAWGVPAVGKRQIVEEAQARLERLRQLQRAPAPAPALLSAAAIGDAAAAAAAGAPAARLSVRIAFISERWVPTAPEVPAGARTSLRVALRVKPGVKTIDVGRLAGKVKLFFGLLQQSRALSPENGFLAYTAQQEAGEGGAPSNYVVSVYFGDPPARIAQRFFNQFLGGRLQVEQMYARFTGGREEKEPPAPPPAAPQQPPSFEGDFSVSLGLSARQLCAVLVALSGGEASRGIELPNAVRELLAFLGRTCEELGEVTLRSEERCLRLTMSGFALSEVVAFVERADGAAWHDELAPLRFLRSGNPPIEQVASELFAQHPALLAFLEFGALFAAAPLAGCAVLLVGMQRAILYHPEPVFAAFPDAFGLPYEDCILACEDGVNLHSWLVRAAGKRAAPTIVYCHGNAGNVSHRVPLLAELYEACRRQVNILALSYRGYGQNARTPSPTESGLIADARAAIAHVRARPELGSEIFLFGVSLGGAVAIAAAAADAAGGGGAGGGVGGARLAGIVVENSFTSVSDMVGPLLNAVFSAQVRDPWDSLSRVSRVAVPGLYLSGRCDELVPPFMMNALFESHGQQVGEAAALGEVRLPEGVQVARRERSKLLVYFPAGEHNTTCEEEHYFGVVAAFVEAAVRR